MGAEMNKIIERVLAISLGIGVIFLIMITHEAFNSERNSQLYNERFLALGFCLTSIATLVFVLVLMFIVNKPRP